MKESHVVSYALAGITPHRCVIHTTLTEGKGVFVVGIPDRKVRESLKESLLRTVTALSQCGFSLHAKKIIIEIKFKGHISLVDKKKLSGLMLDLPIALSLLMAAKETDQKEPVFASGYLLLNGKTRGAVVSTRSDMYYPDSLTSITDILNQI